MNKFCLVFIFCCAVLFGSGYNVNRYFNFEHSSDSKSYMKMANNDYNVTVTHKYRFVIPFIISKLNHFVLYFGVKSNRTQQVLFLIINTVFMALAGVFIYLTLQTFGFDKLVSLLGILPFLTSRWAVFATAIPLVESLFLCAICGFLYAILAKKYAFALFFLFLGPIAKESFWLYVPLVFLGFETPKISRTSVAIVLSAAFFLSVRFFIDYLFPKSNPNGLSNVLEQINTIAYSIRRICTLKGFGELFFVFSWFNIFIIYSLIFSKVIFSKCDKFIFIFIFYVVGVTLIQMLLSGDIDRMFFLLSPLYCLVFSFCFSSVLVHKKRIILE